MRIRVYLDDNTTQEFLYETNEELMMAMVNFEHYNFNWEFV